MKLISTVIISLLFIVFYTSCKKEFDGCTDELAVNYDPEATNDNGTCDYSTTYTISSDVFNGFPRVFVTIKDRGEGTGTNLLTNDKIWVLDGMVSVKGEQELSIEPGTVILGKAESGLVVEPGAKIYALGEVEEPIIFTHEDDVNLDARVSEKGKWTGITILGKAKVNSPSGTANITGIAPSFGGGDDADSSGVMRYVSIRHAGKANIDGSALASLNLAGVGAATLLDHIEIYSSASVGIQFLGGAAQVKHALVSFANQHAFSFDYGYHGKGQYWIGIDNEKGEAVMAQHKGGANFSSSQSYVTPQIYNATFIGGGELRRGKAVNFTDGAGATYYNSIFVNFGYGIEMERTFSGESSASLYEAGYLNIGYSSFYNVSRGDPRKIFAIDSDGIISKEDSASYAEDFQAYFTDNKNDSINTGVDLPYIDAVSGLEVISAPADAFFTSNVSTRGAVSEGLWFLDWTQTHKARFLLE